MKVFSIVNLKGGVGKTVTAVNLAYVLSNKYGKRTLLIDADPQGNATSYAKLPEAEWCTLADYMLGDQDDPYAGIIPCANLGFDILPADSALYEADIVARTQRAPFLLQTIPGFCNALEEDGEYDAVVIDCPPNFTTPCISAIAASTDIIVPLRIDQFAISGMKELTTQINGVRTISPGIRIAGILVTQLAHVNIQQQGLQYLRDHAPAPVFKQTIRRAVAVEESTFACKPVELYKPHTEVAADYRAWIDELMEVAR